jgi:hypothetical protein
MKLVWNLAACSGTKNIFSNIITVEIVPAKYLLFSFVQRDLFYDLF